MDRRAKLASVIAVTATLSTGGMAAWATTGALHAANAGATPGKVQLVDDTTHATASDDQPASNPSSAAPESASPESPEHAGSGAAAPAGAPAASPMATESTSGEQHQSNASPEAPEPEPSPPPSTSPPVVADPPTTTPGINCHGSDDGMTEAQKQAREAACHAGGGDD